MARKTSSGCIQPGPLATASYCASTSPTWANEWYARGGWAYAASSAVRIPGGSAARRRAAGEGSVVVAAGAMHVAMGEFFDARVAHVGHLDGEVQRLAGERMVAVDGHGVLVEAGHDHRQR